MSDYIKDLNIIDFLGITVPGCLLVLLISGDNPSLLLWASYFGADAGPVIRGIFLAIAGYVIGMILHEIGDLAEKGVWCFTFLDPKAYAINAVGIDAVKDAVCSAKNELHKAYESDGIFSPNIRGILGCILTITILFLCTVGFPAAMNASIGVTVPQALLDSDGEGIASDVGKLIPPSYMIHLPTLHELLQYYSNIELDYSEGDGVQIYPWAKNMDLQDTILMEIYRKTGVLFVRPKNYVHYIVPTTIRGLNQLLYMLSRMKELPMLESCWENFTSAENLVEAMSMRIKLEDENLRQFSAYFTEGWIKVKVVHEGDQHFLKTLSEESSKV